MTTHTDPPQRFRRHWQVRLAFYMLGAALLTPIPTMFITWDYEKHSTSGDYVGMTVLSLLLLLFVILFIFSVSRPIIVDGIGVTTSRALFWRRTYLWSEIKEVVPVFLIVMSAPGIELVGGKRVVLYDAQAFVWKESVVRDAVIAINAGLEAYRAGLLDSGHGGGD